MWLLAAADSSPLESGLLPGVTSGYNLFARSFWRCLKIRLENWHNMPSCFLYSSQNQCLGSATLLAWADMPGFTSSHASPEALFPLSYTSQVFVEEQRKARGWADHTLLCAGMGQGYTVDPEVCQQTAVPPPFHSKAALNSMLVPENQGLSWGQNFCPRTHF